MKYALSLLGLILIGLAAFAGGGGPPPPPPPPPCWPPPCIPIDGGAGFLIAAGVAYAGKKIYDRKKNKAES